MPFFIPAFYVAGAAVLSLFVSGCENQSKDNQESLPGGLPQPKERVLKPVDPSKKLNELIGKTNQPQSILTRETTKDSGTVDDPWEHQWMFDAMVTSNVLQYCKVGPKFDSCVQKVESLMDALKETLSTTEN